MDILEIITEEVKSIFSEIFRYRSRNAFGKILTLT